MKLFSIIAGIITLFLGFVAGISYSNFTLIKNDLPICNVDYTFINDTAGCTASPKIQKHLYIELVDELQSRIAFAKREGKVISVSVYFRDLQQGPTFGINEKDNFAPASLLKVPLLLAYLSLKENNSDLFNQKLSYEGSLETFAQTASSSSPLLPNKEYSIGDLVERMIVNSDNGAYTLLFKGITNLDLDGDSLQQTMIDLGLVNPNTPEEDTISVKSYSSLFRQLYNASYLSPASSEYALELLSRSEYKKGIAAGVKQGVPVAHKFGERSSSGESGKQLHDCGIIYFPENPYLLCIMSKGNNYVELEKIIAEISLEVYQEVVSRKL